jgi:hypothetical protein
MSYSVSYLNGVLQGSCCSALPVGAEGYEAAHSGQNLAKPWQNRRDTPAAPAALLGVHATAAAAQPAALPGIGPLLPLWRAVARILTPAFHPVRNKPQIWKTDRIKGSRLTPAFHPVCSKLHIWKTGRSRGFRLT